MLEYRKTEMALNEGALALLTPSRGDGGNVFVQGASVPTHPDTPWTRRTNAWSPDAPKTLPQVAVGAEHYNRIVRLLDQGETVKIEMDLEVAFFKGTRGIM